MPLHLGFLDCCQVCCVEVSLLDLLQYIEDADWISEDDSSIMCVTEQRSGEPSVIRYVPSLHSLRDAWLMIRVFPINREEPSSRTSACSYVVA
jgi:hypothetical protein